LEEGKRVLRNGGALHLLLHTYSRAFVVYRKYIDNTRLSQGFEKHPNCLRFAPIQSFLKDLGFQEVMPIHDKQPFARLLEGNNRSGYGFFKEMIKGQRSLRAFYRLEIPKE
jgi:hypothetical protein